TSAGGIGAWAVVAAAYRAAPTGSSVSLTAPAQGSTVFDSVTVSADATDNLGIAGVRFALDGVYLGAEDATSPYRSTWDTRATPNGVHQLTAIARNQAGQTSNSASVTVTVSNPQVLTSITVAPP